MPFVFSSFGSFASCNSDAVGSSSSCRDNSVGGARLESASVTAVSAGEEGSGVEEGESLWKFTGFLDIGEGEAVLERFGGKRLDVDEPKGSTIPVVARRSLSSRFDFGSLLSVGAGEPDLGDEVPAR
jgi:hypothetical protein